MVTFFIIYGFFLIEKDKIYFGNEITGYEYSHVRNRLWRKTRSPTGLDSPKCQGVDANRNFEFKVSY